MKIKIISFTERGYELGSAVKDALVSHDIELLFKGKRRTNPPAEPGDANAASESGEKSLNEICKEAFERSIPLLFIGASGIAVRSIAPFVRDKLTDPPVLVMDELGQYVVPLLSGHVGGANELAAEISNVTSAAAVITTATDINEKFSIDLFAKKNGLTIAKREGIAAVSTKALEGKPVTISIKNYPPEEPADAVVSDEPDLQLPDGSILKDAAFIVLCPKQYAIGIGCRKGKSFDELRAFALQVLEDHKVDLKDVGCIATIDIKKDEEGLKALSQAWRMPLITFDAALLGKAQGVFTASELVMERVGVDNVCERAAVLAAGPGSRLIVRKTAANGMTAALAMVKQTNNQEKR